jgi:hemerythrin
MSTNQALTINLLAECGAMSAAIEAEHDEIDLLLRTLNKMMLAGAETPAIVCLADLIADFYQSHFVHEETFLRARGVSGLRAHVVAHLEMMQRLRQTRSAIQDGDAEAILDVVDLLETQRRHTAMFDIPAYEEILRRPNRAERGDSQRKTELARLKRMAA